MLESLSVEVLHRVSVKEQVLNHLSLLTLITILDL